MDAHDRLTALGIVDDWADALVEVEPIISRLGTELLSERFLPDGPNVLRAFTRPIANVRVVLVGQDPYPTPGHAVGLAFSVARMTQPVPKSLQNIFKELHDDLGYAPSAHGDLSSWFDQGVLLLNRCLTVAPGTPGSHRGRGWEQVTETAIKAVLARHETHAQPMSGILWGRDARNLAPMFHAHDVPYVESPHPSPLSASSGFFGSRPFSRTNTLLEQQGAEPIRWRLL